MGDLSRDLASTNVSLADIDPATDESTPAPSTRRPWVNKIHLFLDSPKSSVPALSYAIIMLMIILGSTIAFLVSSLPRYYNKRAFVTLQIITGSIFTVDYLLRLITSDHWYRWAIRPLSLVDLLVVVPFLVSLVPSITLNQQFIALRAVRLLYILKIIKITSYVHMTRVVAQTLKKSKDGFVVLLVGVVVMCLFYSTLIFIAENSDTTFDSQNNQWIHSDGSKTEYQSIFDGVWWCLVTFTTVGYGDIYPVTTFGKVVGVFTMFTGVLLTAFPVAIFTANFTDLWKERKFHKRADFIRGITTPAIKPRSKKQKQEDIEELMRAIEKEERQIAASLQTARDMVYYAHNSHKHMQLLISHLREAIDAPTKHDYEGSEASEEAQENQEEEENDETQALERDEERERNNIDEPPSMEEFEVESPTIEFGD